MYVSTFPTIHSELDTESARRHRDHLRAVGRPALATSADAPITVRVLGDSDEAALRRLAGRDSSPVPAGRLLGAEVGDALVAAVSLDEGRVLADPFHATRPAVEMLRVRARQLKAASGPSRLRRVLDALGRGNAHAGLAGSPPGAGGRLLKL